MTKRRVRPVSKEEIARAVEALGLSVPVRSAERKGTQIVLHTRNGDYTWTPPRGAGGRPAPAKGSR